MKKPKPDPQLAAWCAALSTEFAEDQVPPGWLTSNKIGEMLNKSTSRISEMLKTAMRNGKCEKKLFRVKNAGTVRPVPHYKLVGK